MTASNDTVRRGPSPRRVVIPADTVAAVGNPDALAVYVAVLAMSEGEGVSPEALAERFGVGLQRVRRALKDLERLGLARLMPVQGEGGRMAGREWEVLDADGVRVEPAAPVTNGQVEQEPQAVPAPKEKGDALPPTDWRYRAAKYVYDFLSGSERGIPPSVTRGKSKERLVQEWAQVVRKLVERDGYTQADIGLWCRYVCREDCWYVETGNFYSMKNIRSSRSGKETSKFDVMMQKARAWKAGTEDGRPDAGADLRNRRKVGEFS